MQQATAILEKLEIPHEIRVMSSSRNPDLVDEYARIAFERGLKVLVCTTGIILGAAYMLWLYRRVVFGDLVKDDVRAMPDLSKRELALLVPIAAAVLWMGVYPESFLAPMRGNVASIVAGNSQSGGSIW